MGDEIVDEAYDSRVVCPAWAPGIGFMGCVAAVILASKFFLIDVVLTTLRNGSFLIMS